MNQNLNWDDFRFLLSISRVRSISKAAKKLGVNHSTVSRRLARLEEEFDTKFFKRLKDGLEPTDVCLEVAELCDVMEEHVGRIEKVVASIQTSISGRVKVSAGPILCNDLLAYHSAEFVRRYPGLMMEYVVGTHFVDIARGEADIGFRVCMEMTSPGSEDLIARKVGTMAWALYCQPSYFGGQVPTDHSELEGCAFLSLSRESSSGFAKVFLALAERLKLEVVLESSVLNVLSGAAVAGQGLVLLPCIHGHRLGLTKVGAPLEISNLWLVYHADNRRNPVVQSTLDYLKEITEASARLLEGRH